VETIRLHRDGPVLVATIDHPRSERNAVDGDLHRDLAALFRALRSVQTEPDPPRAILLTGSKKAFSAGGDFDWFPSLDSIAKLDALRLEARQLIWDLLDVELPIVCGVNGPAVGLGASIALLCDVIVMADTATILDPHVRVGIVAGDGGVVIWPLVLGPARAKQYLLTGDPVTAVEAERLGLVNEVVPADGLADRAMAWAQRLAAGAPMALRYTKLAINQQLRRALIESFDLSTALEISTLASEDHKEALAALRERRPPTFQGR
jgi:enoyl-CoA hydratase